MLLQLSASLPALYGGLPIAAACAAAAADGFSCVELWEAPARRDWPDLLAALAAHGLSLTSVNSPAGVPPSFGTAADPATAASWRAGLLDVLELARLAGATAVNVLAGGRVAGQTRASQLGCLRDNVEWALDRGDGSGPMLLLEPLNGADRSSPVLGRLDDAVGVLEQVDSTRLRLLFDAYHLYQEEPDLLLAFERVLPYVGHVQLADFPGRSQPGTGELPWTSLLACIARSGYRGRIGCEFVPTDRDEVAASRAGIAAVLTVETVGAS